VFPMKSTLTMKQINRRHTSRGSFSSISSGEVCFYLLFSILWHFVGSFFHDSHFLPSFLFSLFLQTDFDSDCDLNEQPVCKLEESPDMSSLSSLSLAHRIWTTTGNFLGWYDSSNETDSCTTPPPKEKKKRGELRFCQSVKVVLIPSMVEYRKAELVQHMWWRDEDYSFFKKEAIAEIRSLMSERDCTVKEASVALYQMSTPTYASGQSHPARSHASLHVPVPAPAPDIVTVDFIPIGHIPVLTQTLDLDPTIFGRVPPVSEVQIELLLNSAHVVIYDLESNKENTNHASSKDNIHVNLVTVTVIPNEPVKKLELHFEQCYLEHRQLDAFTAAEIVSPQRVRDEGGKVQAKDPHLPRKFFGDPNDLDMMMSAEMSRANIQSNAQQSGSLFEAF